MDAAPLTPDAAWTLPSAPRAPQTLGGRAPHRLPGRRSAAWAAGLGWLVPGAGQAFVGRPGAGCVLLLAIGGLFAGGLALTDFTCVNPETYPLEFVAQALIGGPTAAALQTTAGTALTRLPPWFDVGRLFVVVAGFLNLVALCDALGECLRRNVRVQALTARLQARSARAADSRAGHDVLTGLPLSEAPPLARADEPLPAMPQAAPPEERL